MRAPTEIVHLFQRPLCAMFPLLRNPLLVIIAALACITWNDVVAFQIRTSETRQPFYLSSTGQPAQSSNHESSPSSSSSRQKSALPPVLQQIADERAQYQMNLGRAMDALRTDMPKILSRPPGTFYRVPVAGFHTDVCIDFDHGLTRAPRFFHFRL